MTDRDDFDAVVAGIAEEAPMAALFDRGAAMLEAMGLMPALAEWLEATVAARVAQMVEGNHPNLPELRRLCEGV